ncbi:MAG TPA: NAD-dependent epimerase/dehydratase family protein [Ktedonobacteraceae bacterium]|jgi:UDP-glucose 4-epimerase|nr:NAD-dependent epimerase/dehydratase family protein [Ktedonobacteraceae bacterium]
MKIAITGGAGFIGAALTQAYLDAGHDVLVIDNLLCGSEQTIDPRARFYRIDIRDQRLLTILQAERPDIVSHHATQRFHHLPGELSLQDADVHIRGLLNVLAGCVEAQVGKFIFASGGNDLYKHTLANPLPFTECSATAPQQPHDISTLAGECYVRYYTQNYGLAHSILRYADVYGETAQMQLSHLHHPLSYFIHMLAEQRRPIIRTASEALRDHIFIKDVVEANLRILTRGKNQTLHISTGKGYTLNNLFQMAAFLLDSKLEPIYLSSTQEENSTSILDNSKACEILDWQPEISMLEGLTHALKMLGVTKSVPAYQETPLNVTSNQESLLLRA